MDDRSAPKYSGDLWCKQIHPRLDCLHLHQRSPTYNCQPVNPTPGSMQRHAAKLLELGSTFELHSMKKKINIVLVDVKNTRTLGSLVAKGLMCAIMSGKSIVLTHAFPKMSAEGTSSAFSRATAKILQVFCTMEVTMFNAHVRACCSSFEFEDLLPSVGLLETIQ